MTTHLTPATFENLAFRTGALIEIDPREHTAHMTVGGQEYVTAVGAR